MYRRDLVRGALAFGALGALGFTVGGCSSAAGPSKLRVGLLPIIDALPIYVADSDGLFKAESVEVELTLFASALERDAAIQAGQLDLELNDLISAGLLAKDKADRYKIIRMSYHGTPEAPMMSIVAGPESKISGPDDLKGASIAISGNTVIEYATDRLLQDARIDPKDVQKTEVTKIPVRMEMLSKGQIQAATLPEPFATLAIKQGGKLILDDGKSRIGQSEITARKETIDGNAEGLRRFLRAYEKAVEAVAKDPTKYRPLFIDKAKIPEAIQDSLSIPPYPAASVPSKADVDSAMGWMVTRGLLSEPISHDSLVNDSLLPGK